MIGHKKLLEVISYDPETGVFRWKKQPRQRAMSEIAGTVNPYGYRQIGIQQRVYKAHRLAWFYVHGVWPSGQIDHANGKKDDNRIENLREANFSQNQANARRKSTSQTGYKGVHFHKASGLFMARITVNYKTRLIGYFRTPEEAHAAYVDASHKAFGQYARAA